MKAQKWLAGVCVLSVLTGTGLAQAQMILLDSTPQNTTQASQTVKNSMAEYEAEKARREAAERAAAEARYNSPQAQAERQRQNEQYQEEERRKKREACERAKAKDILVDKLWYC